MKRLNLYLIVFIFLCGCNQQENNLAYYLKPNYKHERLNSTSLLFTDSIKIAVPDESLNYFWQTDILNDRFLYGFSMYEPLAMSVFDLQESQFINFVRFDKNLIGGTMIVNFKVLSADSILLAVWPGNHLVLANGKGNVLSKVQGSDLDVTTGLDAYIAQTSYDWSTNSYLENMTYDAATNLLYIPISPYLDYSREGDYVNAKRHGVYDLSNKGWKALFGPYEGTLKHLNGGHYYQDMEFSYQLITPKDIYITYPVDHSVYVYDKKNLKLKKTIDISPSMATTTPRPLYGQDIDDDRKLNDLRRSSPFYGPLYYHEAVNKFSRFYNLQKMRDNSPERVLVIYDENFNTLAEEVFSQDFISHIQPSSTGFIIQPYDAMTIDTATFFRVSIIDKR